VSAELFEGDDGPLWSTAVFGKEVEDFLNSDVGTYLLRCAQAEAEAAYDRLKTVSPWRRRYIQKLQNEIWRAESIRDWLANSIQAGRNATTTLEGK